MTGVSKIRKELTREMVTITVDTREQTPLNLHPYRTHPGTLQSGDYSVVGITQHVVVERKSLQDLVMCVGRERERFEREIDRLMAFEARMIVVEASWAQINAGGWRGRITPAQVRASCLAWIARGVPMHFNADRLELGREVGDFLYLAARRRWRQLIGLGMAG